MTDIIIAVICAALGSAGLFSFIQFLIARRDKKKGEIALLKKDLEDLSKQLKKMEKDLVRLQLLDLIHNQPESVTEIMTVAEHYFDHLKANWYMTTIFKKYLKQNSLPNPTWWKGGDEND